MLMISLLQAMILLAAKLLRLILMIVFFIKDLSPLKHCLGIEVTWSPDGIFLCLRKYTLGILTESDMLGSRPSPFPTEQQHSFSFDSGLMILAVIAASLVVLFTSLSQDQNHILNTHFKSAYVTSMMIIFRCCNANSLLLNILSWSGNLFSFFQ